VIRHQDFSPFSKYPAIFNAVGAPFGLADAKQNKYSGTFRELSSTPGFPATAQNAVFSRSIMNAPTACQSATRCVETISFSNQSASRWVT